MRCVSLLAKIQSHDDGAIPADSNAPSAERVPSETSVSPGAARDTVRIPARLRSLPVSIPNCRSIVSEGTDIEPNTAAEAITTAGSRWLLESVFISNGPRSIFADAATARQA